MGEAQHHKSHPGQQEQANRLKHPETWARDATKLQCFIDDPSPDGVDGGEIE